MVLILVPGVLQSIDVLVTNLLVLKQQLLCGQWVYGHFLNNPMSPDGVSLTITHLLLLAQEMLETNFEKQVIKHHIKNNDVITSWSG